MNLKEEILESVVELIEPNIQFYRQGSQDKAKYLADSQTAEFLADMVTNVVIPFLLIPVSEFYNQKIAEWRQKRIDSRNPQVAPADDIQQELSRILTTKGAIVITADKRDEAISIVADYLSFYGWPDSIAEDSGKEIVDAIRDRLSR